MSKKYHHNTLNMLIFYTTPNKRLEMKPTSVLKRAKTATGVEKLIVLKKLF